jgi:hypothetical protein
VVIVVIVVIVRERDVWNVIERKTPEHHNTSAVLTHARTHARTFFNLNLERTQVHRVLFDLVANVPAECSPIRGFNLVREAIPAPAPAVRRRHGEDEEEGYTLLLLLQSDYQDL